MRGKRTLKDRRSKRKRLRVVPLAPIPIYRLRLVFSILFIGLLGLSTRMAWLQILEAPSLQARARSVQIQKQQPLGTRRSIVDRKGRLIALDEERFRLWAHPRYFNFLGDEKDVIRKPYEVAQKLSKPLSKPVGVLATALSHRPSGIKLAEALPGEIASEIKQLRISGLDLEPYPQRVYPHGSLFANVVGFLNIDRIPQAGLELSLNNKLLRKEKARNVRRGADGTPLPDDLRPGFFYGDDLNLRLTLDARLQELSLKALASQVKEWNATRGVAIVMDSSNGELLALASTPTYDPNNYWEYSPALFREWSVQDLFEPGSTFKPINLALALEEGAIGPGGTVYDSGKVNIGGWSIYNHDREPNGQIDFAKVLQVSSNVGMVKIMSKLNPSNYWDWLHRLGLDSMPQTDLPGAVAGRLKSKDVFVGQPIEPAVASYGQGFSLTPLKLIQLHGLLANGGKLVTPHITRGLGRETDVLEPLDASGFQLLSPEITKTVSSWMESVVEHGSGQAVKTPGYRIGGKTGTAQKAEGGIYKPGSKICSFVATLPMENPRYVVLVVVDEPKGEHAYGSTVAAPVAKKIIDGLLVLQKIPPSSNKKILIPAER